MRDLDVSLDGIAIAAVNLNQMVNFYNTVFNADLAPSPLGNFTLFRGRMGNLNITVAPNDLLGIRAEKSRYQLSVNVSDLERAIALVKRAGGIQMQEVSVDDGDLYCGITDPDGNSIELVQHGY